MDKSLSRLDFINEKKDKRLEDLQTKRLLSSKKVRKRSTQGDIISKSFL
jgi:hypothetical protein